MAKHRSGFHAGWNMGMHLHVPNAVEKPFAYSCFTA